MLNFAVIGTSWITDSYIESAQTTGLWKLVAVYSRTQEKATEFAKKYKCQKTFLSIEEMCQDTAVDAVYIASPNNLHFEQAKVVLMAGKHAIVEKPVTSNLQEFDALYELAKTAPNGARLIEAYRHIQEKNFKILKTAISKLGPIYGGNFMFAQYSSRYTAVLNGETPTVFSPQYSGGCLTDMGVYPICFALALFGKPVSQTYYPIMTHTGADAGGPIILQYDNFTVTLYTSKCYGSTAPSEVFGEKGTIKVNGVTDIESVTFTSATDKKSEELAGPKTKHNLMEEAEEFYRLINEEDVTGIDALKKLSRDVVSVTQALREANGIVFPADK